MIFQRGTVCVNVTSQEKVFFSQNFLLTQRKTAKTVDNLRCQSINRNKFVSSDSITSISFISAKARERFAFAIAPLRFAERRFLELVTWPGPPNVGVGESSDSAFPHFFDRHCRPLQRPMDYEIEACIIHRSIVTMTDYGLTVPVSGIWHSRYSLADMADHRHFTFHQYHTESRIGKLSSQMGFEPSIKWHGDSCDTIFCNFTIHSDLHISKCAN